MPRKKPGPAIPDDLEEDLLIVMVLGLIGCLLFSAIARHWVPKYHSGSLKAAAACLTWITTLGTARAGALGIHVRIVFIADIVPDGSRRRMELFADLIMLIAAFGLFAISCMMVHYSLTHPVPRGHPLVYAAVPVGMGLTIYRLCQRIVRARRERA